MSSFHIINYVLFDYIMYYYWFGNSRLFRSKSICYNLKLTSNNMKHIIETNCSFHSVLKLIKINFSSDEFKLCHALRISTHLYVYTFVLLHE